MIPSLLDLSSEQRKVIDIPFYGCHVITGAPGSGKTVMAIYRAWALATIGRAVTLFTRSNLLHQYLEQLAPDVANAYVVTTYHRWIREFWSAHFAIDPPKTGEDDWSYDWIEMQRRCIFQKVRSTTNLVIDEGQNLPVGFYQLCRIVGVDVTVFADENERIDDEQSAISEICRVLGVNAGPLALLESHRSTRQIAMLASEFSVRANGDAFLPVRMGRIPGILKISSLREFAAEISQYFEQYPERSIGIICRSICLLRDVQSELTRLGLTKYTQAYVHDDQYRHTVDFSTRPIRIVTTASMKGLEFDSVFVPDLHAYTEDRTSVEARLRLFVLCTRARKDLCFAYLGPQEPAILSGIRESLLARRTVDLGV
ncbi:hypothetical protein [Nocardia sp. NPDC050175]|uniref:hypothetical protein n=1 Tax=Nocardia sp. NPDC050175 TaxID=3364317 RepID=UPI00378FE221